MYSKTVAALCAAITLSTVATVNAQRQPGITPASDLNTASLVTRGWQQSSDDGSLAGPSPTCSRAVLASNNFVFQSTAPNTNAAFQRGVYLITAAELAASGYTSGASPTTIGWRYNPGTAGTAPLKVYLENTADTTNLKGTDWATVIGTMTMVHDGTMAVPAAAGSVDVTMTGGTPFVYSGGGIYVGYDWGQFVGTVNTANRIFVINTGTTLFATNAAAAPATLASSIVARPETRLNGVSLINDAAVTNIQAMGLLAPCRMPIQIYRAVVTNNGQDTLTNVPVTLTITGADTFSDTQTVASVTGCGGRAVVTFLGYTPTALGSNTMTVSIPNDTNNANNSLVRNANNTTNEISYKYPGSTTTTGVGIGTVPGPLVAKFVLTAADVITQVKVEFPNGPSATALYRIAIYPDNAGVPSTTFLYQDAADRTITAAGPVTLTLDAPVAVPAGAYYVGVQQRNATNPGMGYDVELNIRPGTFFFAAQLPPVTWVDVATGNQTFKFNIGIVLQGGCTEVLGACCDAGGGCTPDLSESACDFISGTWQAGQSCTACCPADVTGDGQVNVSDLLAVIGGWGTPCVTCNADIDNDNDVDVSDLLAVIGNWGACD